MMCFGFLKPSLVGMRSFIGKPYMGGRISSAKRKVSSVCGCRAVAMSPLLTFRFADEILPPMYGFPMKLRIPTKLGFKNPKHIMSMFVSNEYPGGYWEDQGYNWFSGS